ncbi:MAG: hypothetical protein LBR95_07675 [Azoarcus sp.]|jgi:hypothetical protein|nr:hypothetical protein [Azoarcus sp.]
MENRPPSENQAYVCRKKTWPVWLMLGFTIGLPVYYGVSFPLVKLGRLP